MNENFIERAKNMEFKKLQLYMKKQVNEFKISIKSIFALIVWFVQAHI